MVPALESENFLGKFTLKILFLAVNINIHVTFSALIYKFQVGIDRIFET